MQYKNGMYVITCPFAPYIGSYVRNFLFVVCYYFLFEKTIIRKITDTKFQICYRIQI